VISAGFSLVEFVQVFVGIGNKILLAPLAAEKHRATLYGHLSRHPHRTERFTAHRATGLGQRGRVIGLGELVDVFQFGGARSLRARRRTTLLVGTPVSVVFVIVHLRVVVAILVTVLRGASDNRDEARDATEQHRSTGVSTSMAAGDWRPRRLDGHGRNDDAMVL